MAARLRRQGAIALSDDRQPEAVEPPDLIGEAFGRWDGVARSKQQASLRFGLFTALLGPVAVLLLTVQVLVFPHSGPVAITLISLELLALLVALSSGFLDLSPHVREWVAGRLRAEILRRERLLVRARVGPYLTAATPDAVRWETRRRLSLIDDPMRDPVDLLMLHDPGSRTTWREALEDARAGATAPPEPDCLDRFLAERVTDQRQWFSKRGLALGRRDARYENLARLALTLALVLAAMHFVALTTGAHQGEGGRSVTQVIIEILAIVLPPVGSMATAIQSLIEARRLSRSYRDYSQSLAHLETAFIDLERAAVDAASPEERSQLDFGLKRLVLRTEELLAGELRQWWLLTSR